VTPKPLAVVAMVAVAAKVVKVVAPHDRTAM
jgi:hypothetical protein